jgi:hypothetical protein
MTDFRALCARMADELDHYRQLLMDDRRETHALAIEARAALAEQPVGPTDEELLQIFDTVCLSEGGTVDEIHLRGLRAVLARWGQPAATPIPVAERLPGPEDLNGILEECWWYDHACWYLDTYQANYTRWLPANALPLPTND